MPQRHPTGPNLTHGNQRALAYQQSQLNGEGSCSTRTFLIDELDYSDADLGPDVACSQSSPSVPCPGLPQTGSTGSTGSASSLPASASILGVSTLAHTGQCPTCTKNGELYVVVSETPCDPNASSQNRTILVSTSNSGPNSAQSVGLKMSGGSCIMVSAGGIVDNCQADHMIDDGSAAGYGSFTSYTNPPSQSFSSTTPNGASFNWTSTPTSCACCIATNPNGDDNAHCQTSSQGTPAVGQTTASGAYGGTNYGGGAMPISSSTGMSGSDFSGTNNYTAGEFAWVSETKNGQSPALLCKYMRSGASTNALGSTGSPGASDQNNQLYASCCAGGQSGTTTDCPVSNNARSLLNAASYTGNGGSCCSGNPYSIVTLAPEYGGCGGYGKVVTITSTNIGAIGYSLTSSLSVHDWPDWLKEGAEACAVVETFEKCYVNPWIKICCCQSTSSACKEIWGCKETVRFGI